MKPGYKTTEFWITIATVAASLFGAAENVLPKQWALVAAALSSACYSIARGQAKSNPSNKSDF